MRSSTDWVYAKKSDIRGTDARIFIFNDYPSFKVHGYSYFKICLRKKNIQLEVTSPKMFHKEISMKFHSKYIFHKISSGTSKIILHEIFVRLKFTLINVKKR